MDREISRCRHCQDGGMDFDFTMAFQPIVDVERGEVWGYEALVRGLAGESAFSVLSRVTDSNRYHFDQACRVKAIGLAGRLFEGRPLKLSINFLPNAVYEPSACIRASLAAADKAGIRREQLMFEFTENEKMSDTAHVQRIIEAYKRFGFITAIDDFGAGYSGLGLLARFVPDLVKIDMDLIRGLDTSQPRQAIVRGIVTMARDLGVTVLAEGIETEAEATALRHLGIRLLQGYLFGKPALESLPSWTSRAAIAA